MITNKGIRELSELVSHFFSAYPARSTLIIFSIAVAALAEGLGTASLLPLINLVIEPDEELSGLGLLVAEAFVIVGLDLSLGGILLIIVMMTVTRSVLVLLTTMQAGYSAAHAAMNMRLEVLRAILNARWQHFVDFRPGELASAINNEPLRAANSYIYFCRALGVGLQLLVYLALSFVISWKISLAALLVGGASGFALNRFVRVTNRAGKAQTNLQRSFMTRLLQGLDGMKPLKAMGRESHFAPLIESDIRSLNHIHRTIIVSQEAVSEFHEIIRALTVAGGLYVLLTVWSQPVENLFVLAFLFARTLQKVSILQHCFQFVVLDLPAFTFLRSTISKAVGMLEPNPPGIMPRFAAEIALRDVRFAYGTRNVLENVTLALPAGNFISIVGSSGAGKTTVADLITGLLRPQGGEVWIDDVPMRDVDIRAWRRMIGYVPQETFLFHDTIAANVTLGDPEIAPPQLENALRRAEAWEFVAELPEGVDTVVGERGARLSGGQRQRIAIARALLRDPAMLILDEATTALDPETEADIVATLRRLSGKVTILSISHQPAMRAAADIVYCLENGHVSAVDTDDRITATAPGTHRAA